MVLQPYIVRQGDTMTCLAMKRGFDAEEIWNHVKNREIRELRSDTHSIRVRTHRRYVSTRGDANKKKYETFLGPDPESANNEKSTTTLPPFVDP
jgi:hypothetical protein